MLFKRNILLLVIIGLLCLTTAASYYRFIVTNDYLVSYEGSCDPENDSCFVDCEDDECTTEYYYTIVQRSATNIKALCGKDITDCEAAHTCSLNEQDCNVSYCDPEEDTDACDDINQSSL